MEAHNNFCPAEFTFRKLKCVISTIYITSVTQASPLSEVFCRSNLAISMLKTSGGRGSQFHIGFGFTPFSQFNEQCQDEEGKEKK